MNTPAAALSLRGVSKAYPSGDSPGAKPVLHRVTFNVQAGDAVAVVGENGAGKTTLLGLSGGVLRPGEGAVHVFGEPAHRWQSRRHCVLAPRPDRLPRDLTALETLSALAIGHLGEHAPQRMEAVTQMLELGEVLHQPLGALSMGFRARVALACALLPQCPLLLLDEPLTALDPKSKRLAIHAITQERTRGTTLVITTHDVSQLVGCCDRVALIADRSIHPLGTLGRVLAEMPSRLSYAMTPREPLQEGEVRLEDAGQIVVREVSAGQRTSTIEDIQKRGGRLLSVQPQSRLDEAGPDGDVEETLA